MKVEHTVCDVCGRVKGDANKWVKAYIDETSTSIMLAAPEYTRSDDWMDLCSDACIQKRLGEVLDKIRAI
jgi:hypothetical protein